MEAESSENFPYAEFFTANISLGIGSFCQSISNPLFSQVTQIAKSLGSVDAIHRKLPLKNHACYRKTIEKFNSICFDLPLNPYSLGFLRTFSNLCESGVKVEDILSAMDSVCIHPKIVGIV